MMKTLVTYFSASGVTANVAKALADATGSDLFEIRPEQPYSKADLNWMNPLARCNREKIATCAVNMATADEANLPDFKAFPIGKWRKSPCCFPEFARESGNSFPTCV